ncbi:hypothetical protein AB1K83_11845 [Sporosarcina sp. 179-K 3D1 HS]|uniref:hypothetical protein n=1 Tax=Sporosarcina sp. 179-K 3D1 HS TaxID=3232169 RepID=UPI0039A0D5AD
MRLSEIKGFEVKHFLMAKFTSKEWVHSFLEGIIYMNNFKHFIDQEKASKVKGQGDAYEGAHVLEVSDIKIYDQQNRLVGTAELGNLIERYEGVNRIPMFCVANFSTRDFVVLEQTEDRIRIKLEIPSEDVLRIKEVFNADTVALTLSPHIFIERFKKAAEKSDMGLAYGMVDYADYRILSDARRASFDEGEVDFLFTKHDSLAYQKEFRFILTNVETEVPITVNVGNLKDIFIQMNIDDFLTGTFLDMNIKIIEDD